MVTESDVVSDDIVDEVIADTKYEEEVVNFSNPWVHLMIVNASVIVH